MDMAIAVARRREKARRSPLGDDGSPRRWAVEDVATLPGGWRVIRRVEEIAGGGRYRRAAGEPRGDRRE
jgi:hypothetical protein